MVSGLVVVVVGEAVWLVCGGCGRRQVESVAVQARLA
jgi:hypothetical protein